MIGRTLWGLLALSLAASAAGVAFTPDHMLSPGPLADAHAALATDCFACHAPLQGLPAERCVECHTVADVGVRTTKGVALPAGTAFHQELLEQDCVVCHSDHAGPRLTQQERKPFSHALLKPGVRDTCDTCHTAPDDATHVSMGTRCQDCHSTNAWEPATFRHDRLAADVLAACEACHKPPSDNLHAQFDGGCGDCHAQSAWLPATFEHDRYFALDRDHDASCATCHVGGDLSRYTCYGCHEHTAANIAGEHREEGIRDFADCVACHRSGEDEGEGRGRRGGGERGEEGEDDDD
jgi:hypothetical protein